MTSSLKLDELASRAGVSPRTVRYYIQRGLLPPPAFRGPDTSYDEHHLFALRAIRVLQDAYWPLDAIASALSGKTKNELRDIAEGRRVPSRPGDLDEDEPSRTRDRREPSRSRDRVEAEPHPSGEGARGTRYVLAPGLELFVEDGASQTTRALVDAIRDLATRHAPRDPRNRNGKGRA